MDQWTQQFDEHLMRYYAINHHDAGLTDTELARYQDLPPSEAALAFGEDYGLERVDQGWR